MSESIIKAIEAVASQIAVQVGQPQGGDLAVAEALVATQGDYLVSLGYAALFFPVLTISGGIPVARFATSERAEPLDCFHVDLLHHNAAAGRSPDVYAAVGQALAAAWTYALKRQGLTGSFAYDTSSGFDVVYEPQQFIQAETASRFGLILALGRMSNSVLTETNDDIAGLVHAWCDRRAIGPLRVILGCYPILNDLTDNPK